MPATAVAQFPQWLQPGARLRLTFRGERVPVVGTLVRFDRDSVVLRRNASDATLTLPIAGLEHADVRRERGTHMGGGALVGLLAGAAFGFAAGASSDTRSPELVGVVFGGVFGALGAGVGALIGSRMPKDVWEPMTLSAGAGGLGIGFSFRW